MSAQPPAMPDQTSPPRFRPIDALSLCWWLAPLAVIIWWTINSLRQIGSINSLNERFRDFFVFFDGASALVANTPLHLAGQGDLRYIYPPLLAVLLMPLVPMGVTAAAYVWLAIKSICMLISITVSALAITGRLPGCLASTSPRTRTALWIAAGVIAAIGTIILADKIRSEYRMQQSNVLLLLGWAIALWWIDRRPVWAGAALGFVVCIKYTAIIALPYLLLRRRWWAAGAMSIAIAIGLTAPSLIIGWDRTIGGLSSSLGGVGNIIAGNQQAAQDAKVLSMTSIGNSIPTGVLTLTGRTGLDGLTAAIIALLAAGTFAAAWLIYRWRAVAMFAGRGDTAHAAEPTVRSTVALEWVGLIIASLAFSPQTNSPHLVQLVPFSIAIAAAAMWATSHARRWLAIAAALVLLAGLTLPPSYDEASRLLAYKFHRAGWPGACLIISYLLLLASALSGQRASAQ